jgi:nitrogen fixation protein FixH
MLMTMTETLFGGLLAVVLIFFVARRLSFSGYWSAILAGLLPFLAYLAYAVSHPQGGDILAIHLVVFLATAAVLGVFSVTWKKKEKMHWAPKLIIAFFVLLALLNAALLSIATHGLPNWITDLLLPSQDQEAVHTVFPGTVPHDRNKLYEPHQQQVQEQRNLGWQVDVQGLDELKSGVPHALKLTVRDAQDQPVQADNVTFGFWRMANSKDDRAVQLQPAGAGEYQGEILLSDAGRWVVEIHIERGKDAFHTKKSLLVE